MRDRAFIYCGLAIFLGLATFPAWHNLPARVNSRGPNPVLPVGKKDCVAPLEYMRTSHMTLLLNWRQQVVREAGLRYTAYDGAHYTMNLTTTCLEQCHGPRARFCDRCHNYEAVTPTCWDCHLDAPPVLRSAR